MLQLPKVVLAACQNTYLGGGGASGGGSSRFLQYGPGGVDVSVLLMFEAGTHLSFTTAPAGSAFSRNWEFICDWHDAVNDRHGPSAGHAKGTLHVEHGRHIVGI